MFGPYSSEFLPILPIFRSNNWIFNEILLFMFWILFSVNQQLTQDFRIRSLNNFSFSTQQYTSFFLCFVFEFHSTRGQFFSEIATVKPSVKNKFVCVCAIEPDIWKYPFHYSGYIKRNTFFSLCHLFKKILGSWNCKVWMFFLRGTDFWSLIKTERLYQNKEEKQKILFSVKLPQRFALSLAPL